MSKSDDVKRKKESLARILKDPTKRPVLAKQLASQVGSEDKSGGLGLLKLMASDYPAEVQEVLDMIEKMPKPAPAPKPAAKKTPAKKAPKKTSKKAPAKPAKKTAKKAPKKVAKKTKKKATKKR